MDNSFEPNREKQHNFLKTIIIILSFGMLFGINVLSMLIVKDKSSFFQVMLGNLAEIAALVGVFVLWTKVLHRVFPSANDFRFRKLTIYQVMMYLGIALLSLVFVYRLLYWIRGGAAHVTLVPVIYSRTEFQEDMLASIHAVLVAPVLEEMCFRIIPVSVIKTGKNRIVLLAILAVVFALMHTSNHLGALVDATVFCILLLVTHNPLASILCHAFGNLLKTIAGVLSYFNVKEVNMVEGRGTIIIFSTPVTLIIFAMAVALILPAVLKAIQKSKS
ncbi:MAG: CPBP family intramembrane metalloprotease [Eubacterium sp.]|nr:CPBP family intramembrane metalloprotease [Eubacterium sp.]